MATQATVVKFLLVRRVAETTSDVLVDDDRLVKQGRETTIRAGGGSRFSYVLARLISAFRG